MATESPTRIRSTLGRIGHPGRWSVVRSDHDQRPVGTFAGANHRRGQAGRHHGTSLFPSSAPRLPAAGAMVAVPLVSDNLPSSPGRQPRGGAARPRRLAPRPARAPAGPPPAGHPCQQTPARPDPRLQRSGCLRTKARGTASGGRRPSVTRRQPRLSVEAVCRTVVGVVRGGTVVTVVPVVVDAGTVVVAAAGGGRGRGRRGGRGGRRGGGGPEAQRELQPGRGWRGQGQAAQVVHRRESPCVLGIRRQGRRHVVVPQLGRDGPALQVGDAAEAVHGPGRWPRSPSTPRSSGGACSR